MSGPRANRVQVVKYRVSNQAVMVDTNATEGAQIGVNLWDAEGNLITQAVWNSLVEKSGTSATTFTGTTDNVNEGQYNLYFTNRRAQDAVGSILESTANVMLTYVAGTSIKADLTEPTVSAGGTLKKRAFDAKGRLSQEAAATTDDLTEGATNQWFTAARVRSAVLTGLSLATSAVIAATDTVLQAFGKLQAQITDNLLPKGYIDGLQMQWVSGTALTVTSGAAYIEGSSKVLRATSAIAKTSLSLTASTWYHVYLYDNAGTADVEIVTTVPESPYNGTARSKTGDSSRRYVGSAKTDSSGNIIPFTHYANIIRYVVKINPSPYLVLYAGSAVTATNVACSGVIPITASSGFFLLTNADASASIAYGHSQMGYALSASDFLFYLNAGSSNYAEMLIDSNQSIQYLFRSTPSGGNANIRAIGYTFNR